jgi:hypothetical protein
MVRHSLVGSSCRLGMSSRENVLAVLHIWKSYMSTRITTASSWKMGIDRWRPTGRCDQRVFLPICLHIANLFKVSLTIPIRKASRKHQSSEDLFLPVSEACSLLASDQQLHILFAPLLLCHSPTLYLRSHNDTRSIALSVHGHVAL